MSEKRVSKTGSFGREGQRTRASVQEKESFRRREQKIERDWAQSNDEYRASRSRTTTSGRSASEEGAEMAAMRKIEDRERKKVTQRILGPSSSKGRGKKVMETNLTGTPRKKKKKKVK